MEKTSVAQSIVSQLWQDFGLDPSAMHRLELPQGKAMLSSSFALSELAQGCIGASALIASEVHRTRKQAHSESWQEGKVQVPLNAAEAECTALFTINGRSPEAWAKYSGVYKCQDGYIRVHANFDHHRDAFLGMIDLVAADSCSPEQVKHRLLSYPAQELEDRAANCGAIVAKMRSPEAWQGHPQALASAKLPLLQIEKIADSPPITLPGNAKRPLSEIKALDLTRILAGPVATRTLAAYGAKVLSVNGPGLPNIDHVTDTGRGKRSCLLNLKQASGRDSLLDLVSDSDMFVQSYRPGSLEKLGLDVEFLCKHKPGLIYAELSAFGHLGPWAKMRGFDSIVQTACGFNWAESVAYDSSAASTELPMPKAFPVQILDFATGFLIAFGCQVALLKRAHEGGSWRVRCSLLQTANFLRSLGPSSLQTMNSGQNFRSFLQPYKCDYGELKAMPHAAEFNGASCVFEQASVKPGASGACWW
ncbi:CoA transferase [uncultured Pseudoteredinibacter sp.]|uniref:CoA transferase n=1 Tax=uncultured Pseudoteredinibacter sp. TaxID=1641701 RepID=UPI0026323769|nr:CoA transferase [uncultured Pseudoteredinibacter sp.]